MALEDGGTEMDEREGKKVATGMMQVGRANMDATWLM